MPARSRRPDQWTIYQQYVHTSRNIDDLAVLWAVDRRTVRRWLYLADVAVIKNREQPRRPHSGWLARRYTHDRTTIRQIADELDVPASRVRRWLADDGIPVRNHRPLLQGPTRMWLIRAHHVDRRTPADIAAELRVSPTTVRRWLTEHDIPVRDGRRRDPGSFQTIEWLMVLSAARTSRPKAS